MNIHSIYLIYYIYYITKLNALLAFCLAQGVYVCVCGILGWKQLMRSVFIKRATCPITCRARSTYSSSYFEVNN